MSTVGVISHNILRTPDFFALRLEPSRQCADALAGILVSLEGIEERVFAVRGMCLVLAEERELWREHIDPEVGMPFASQDRWVKWLAPRSWSYCYDAKRTIEALKDIAPGELVQVKRCNLEQLKQVSTGVRSLPAVIEAAKTLPEKQFVETMNRDHNQHLEVKHPVTMAPTGDVSEFESAIEMAMALEDCHSRADAIKAIAVSYIQDHAAEYEHLKEQTA
jgi:hypothetical protein